jgi:hydroxylamine reductase (hybrid-cluster protein)
MKKYSVIVSLSVGLLVTSVSADALKNSLTNMLNEKDTSASMVNLSNLDINGKPKPVKAVKKTRSGKTVVATINGHKVLKKEADAYLKKRTQGKVSDFDYLPKKQRLRLIQEMALPVVAAHSAKKELSLKEKEAVLTRMWMQKEAMKIKVTDDQVKKVYDQLKQKSEEQNNTENIPEFESIKNRMKSQIIEKQIIGKLMKDVEIKVQ